MQRMEAYAENLESLVEDRTKDTQEEKERYQDIYYSGLPM